jgi:hypothetical protein
MATKPTQTLGWTTTGAEETEPSVSEKADGFAGGDVVSAEKTNWNLRLTTDWQNYLSDQIFTGDLELSTGDLVLTAGEVKHGNRTLALPSFTGMATTTSGPFPVSGGSGYYMSGASGDVLIVAIPLDVGARVQSIEASVAQGGAGTLTMSLHKHDHTSSGDTQIGTTNTTATPTVTTLTITPGSPTAIVADEAWHISFTSNASSWFIYGCINVVYDTP